MMSDLSWLASEAKMIHEIFNGYFYILLTVLMLVGIVAEYFKWPLGGVPSFGTIVGRALVAAFLLHAYPEITNAVADLTDAISKQLGDLNQFKLILERMSDTLGEFTWSWVSVKEATVLLLSFVSFFILYFSVYVADSFYIYIWVMLYVFSPILIVLFVLPVTASATSALFRSLFEVACWKIVWSVIATILWSTALSQLNKAESQVSFLTVIVLNLILAGSLLSTPVVVHALASGGIAQMAKNLNSIALGEMSVSPRTVVKKVVESTPKGAAMKKLFNKSKSKG